MAAVLLVRYLGQKELQKKDKRTRKFMTMHKALHPSDDKEPVFSHNNIRK